MWFPSLCDFRGTCMKRAQQSFNKATLCDKHWMTNCFPENSHLLTYNIFRSYNSSHKSQVRPTDTADEFHHSRFITVETIEDHKVSHF